MRLRFVFLPIIVLLAASPAAATPDESPEIKGRDWLTMTRQEKGDYIAESMKLFSDAGLRLETSPDVYVDTMDEWLIQKPRYLREDLERLFSTLAYALEPQIRDRTEPAPMASTASSATGVATTLGPTGVVGPKWGWAADDKRDDKDPTPGNY